MRGTPGFAEAMAAEALAKHKAERERSAPRHDHRRSIWIIGGGGLVQGGGWLWCYRCGAIRPNAVEGKWTRVTGPNGENPAMKEKR